MLSLLLLGSVCMNTLRLLSLKMAAAIPGSNPSFSVNRVCMHLSHRTQPLQVRAVQSSVIVSYQNVCSPLPDRIDRSCQRWHQRGRSVSIGVSTIQSSLIFSTWQCSYVIDQDAAMRRNTTDLPHTERRFYDSSLGQDEQIRPTVERIQRDNDEMTHRLQARW